jgi:hypothetical protein
MFVCRRPCCYAIDVENLLITSTNAIAYLQYCLTGASGFAILILGIVQKIEAF